MGKYCSKCRGMEPLQCFQIAGEGKGRWQDRGSSIAWIHLETVSGNRGLQLPRCRGDAWELRSSWKCCERESWGSTGLGRRQTDYPPRRSD